MINGAHVVVMSTNPEADHALLRDVFKLPHVNDGGYLIFGLPPAEISVRGHQGISRGDGEAQNRVHGSAGPGMGSRH
jgi:hypothetical protein